MDLIGARGLKVTIKTDNIICLTTFAVSITIFSIEEYCYTKRLITKNIYSFAPWFFLK